MSDGFCKWLLVFGRALDGFARYSKDHMLTLLTLLGCFQAASSAKGVDTPRAAVDFARDVYPILKSACIDCHGINRQKGKLRLDQREGVFRGGDNGPVVVPGQAERSELYRRITLTPGHKEIMPARGEPLSQAQIGLIRDWVNDGARWPDTIQVAKHWAYVKPTRPKLPAIKDLTWPRNEIDQFIGARLEREGLKPSPEADRATLLRRVTLDLTGLPPSLDEVHSFLADHQEGAYERAVDRLLASPHFGERWARPWLDLARYADSHGYQRDDLHELWAYRDWVIRALNADMPFDQFTIEQLAGDLLPNATEAQRIATGFHRCAPINVEAGSEPEESRVNQVFDRVNTTAQIWLGTTMECAQCHNHKYDPFTQKEYYQLFAFFNNTAIEAERANPKVPSSIRFLGPSMNLQQAPAAKPGQKQAVPSTLVMQELPQPRPTKLFERGNYQQPGEAVQPRTPAVLHPLAEGAPNRLTLARWLVDQDNPLAARVAVNRWWAELFGRGIVSTMEDFGVKGESPTHPELLDWLAVELMDRQWSMKQVLREIVTSATYRQSARVSPELLARDDQNKLCARGPRFRMDAEMIRDNALATAGLLSLKQSGPAIKPYQPPGLWKKVGGTAIEYVLSPGDDRYRRGIYVVWKRAEPYPSFVNFDATARLACTMKRSRSNTPLQALTLLNDPVYVEAAMALARRTLTDKIDADPDRRIRHAFQLCLARAATQTEVRLLRKLYENQREAGRANPKAAGELVSGFAVPPQLSPEEFAAWYVVAAALLNLDEMITKG